MALAAVFQIGSLGDSIVSVPVLRSLPDFFPDCSEYLLVSRFDTALKVLPSHVFDMAWKSKFQVDYRGPEAYEGSKTGWREMLSIGSLLSQLRYYRPRYCLYLMPSDRSPRQVDRDRLFFRAGGVREFAGFRAFSAPELAPVSNPTVHNTEAYLRFRRVWGEAARDEFPKYSVAPLLHPAESAKQSITEWLRLHRAHRDRPLVAICPYSNFPSRTLSDETIHQVLTELATVAGVEPILVGGMKDRVQAEKAVSVTGLGLNACGLFSTEQSAALLQACNVVLCVESGPMHLAGALGVPSVIAYSRITGHLHRWFPLGHNHTILYRDVECAGCGSRVCPVEGHPCLDRISVNQMVSAVMNKLRGLPILPGIMNGTNVLNWKTS